MSDQNKKNGEQVNKKKHEVDAIWLFLEAGWVGSYAAIFLTRILIKLVNPRGIAKFTQESEFIYCALISEGPGLGRSVSL